MVAPSTQSLSKRRHRTRGGGGRSGRRLLYGLLKLLLGVRCPRMPVALQHLVGGLKVVAIKRKPAAKN